MPSPSAAPRYDGRVYIIAGRFTDLIEDVCGRLLRDGATVVLATTDKDASERIAAEAFRNEFASRLCFRFVDHSEAGDIARLSEEVFKRFGRVDGWLNCVIDLPELNESGATEFSTWGAQFERSLRQINNPLRLWNDNAASSDGGTILHAVFSEPGIAGRQRSVLWSAVKAIVDNHAERPSTAARLAAVYVDRSGQHGSGLRRDSVDAVLLCLCGHSVGAIPLSVLDATDESENRRVSSYDPAIARRLSSAGFEPHDIGPQYWQKAYSGHFPALSRLQEDFAPASKKTVVVTGASRGLGRALCEELDRLGHRIIGCARSEAALLDLSRTLTGDHVFRSVDISDDQAMARFAGEAVELCGTPDYVLSNAALTAKSTQTWRLDADDFERLIKVNVLGSVNVLRHFLPGMIRSRRGVLVNFSSAMGRMPSEKSGAYCASKWAVEGLTLSVAQELPPQLAAVTLHPGNIQTEAMRASFGESASLYPTAEQWAQVAVPFLLSLGPSDNGRQLSVPGMTAFRGIGPLLARDAEPNEDA